MKKKFNPKMTRRQVLKAGMIGGAGMMLPLRFLPAKAFANSCTNGQACAALIAAGELCGNNALSDTCRQPKFATAVPDALLDGFKYSPAGMRRGNPYYVVGVGPIPNHDAGLIDTSGGGNDGNSVTTPVWGYGQDGVYSWPGKTFDVQSGRPVAVQWQNNLNDVSAHLLPVDTTLHWCYSLHGYETRRIADDGVPIVTHLHGGHTEYLFDGNPEQFFTPNWRVRGPRFRSRTFMYRNDRPAGNLWYHDHALGITRLNVYAGMAGFYFVRDDQDTGTPDNTLDLPAWPYEKAYAIQDRMFYDNGELFYPAFLGDPFYDGFITQEGAVLPIEDFPNNGGPTALAEFFGDHMVVNGVIWPKEQVEPRNYRIHLLNGTDSRFMAIRFRDVGPAVSDPEDIPGSAPIVPFKVIGSDQGLASDITTINDYLLCEPGSRYDIILDFKEVDFNDRVIMENIGGDEPFGGEIPGPQIFEFTNRIMAFDVVLALNSQVIVDRPDVSPDSGDINFGPDVPGTATRTRKVALFEGKDEYGRLQPLLGTAEPATDFRGRPINWPDEDVYSNNGLTGQMEGAIGWHSPTTENPAVRTTEEWEIWNVTGDAHPVHLHLVHFEIGDRNEINYDSNTNDDGFLLAEFELKTALTGSNETVVVITEAIPSTTPASGLIRVVDDNGDERALDYTSYAGDTFTLTTTADFSGTNASAGNVVIAPVTPANDGAYLVPQAVVQHNGEVGQGFRIVFPTDPNDAYGAVVSQPAGYVEDAPKDMVTALPGQITRIKATFDKPGRYVWHCHILSHEDHEMMRTLYVGPEF